MSSWKQIYETWKQACVPDIDIIPFEVSIHQDDYPWIHKKDKTQSFRQSNPTMGDNSRRHQPPHSIK